MSNPETTETASDHCVSASVCVVGVLAEALAQHRWHSLDWRCRCGDPAVSVLEWPAHVASVVAALPNIAIVPKSDIVRIYRAASTLGDRYMMPTHFGADLEEAERWFALQQKMLDGLPGVDTVRLEYQDMWVTKWEPLA